MENQMTKAQNETSYTRNLEFEASPTAVSTAIDRVGDWWSVYFKGETDAAGKAFTVRFGEGESGTFVDFLVAEHVPGERVVWTVTNCYLPWLEDKTEWTGTSVIFHLSAAERGTVLDFTHQGLVPDVECYDGCVKGWDQYILGSLRPLIETGTGKPN